MNTYKVSETDHFNSIRDSEEIKANNLSAAKRKASRMQCFHGTTLKIMDEAENLLAYKDEDGPRWIEV